jgi:hypothetical protein
MFRSGLKDLTPKITKLAKSFYLRTSHLQIVLGTAQSILPGMELHPRAKHPDPDLPHLFSVFKHQSDFINHQFSPPLPQFAISH